MLKQERNGSGIHMYNMDLRQIELRIEKAACLVLGDAMLDRYIYGEVGRISPEAPIPVVTVTKTRESLGGAANVAANIHSLGCKTYFSGLIGTDFAGTVINNSLQSKNITFCGLALENRMTTTKNRVVGKGQQIVRFDEEICKSLEPQEESRIMNQLELILEKIDLAIISDYAKGVCTAQLCKGLISRASAHHVKVIVDPKGTEWEKYRGAYVVTPNWKEFTEIAGLVNLEDDNNVKKMAMMLLDKFGIDNILITRSERGMILVSKDLYLSVPAVAREVADVSGAGDTALASLAAFLAAGVSLKDAVYWANRAAGLAVERTGTSVIGIEELFQEQENRLIQADFTRKIIELEKLKDHISALKNNNKKIVFTNGCFDILHVGHIQYLNEAKRLGDFLIVAVNTDQSVKRLNKGESRPINGEWDRAMQLAALQMVDAVAFFDEDTPLELISQIMPDILVKGGDYKIEEIVGREYAGETMALPLKEGYSTTGLIEKIQCGV